MKPPTKWYEKRWPEIVRNVNRDSAYELFTNYMNEHKDIWENALRQFEYMKKFW